MYSKFTLGDILLSFSFRYGESGIPSSGTSNRIYWANRGVEYALSRLKIVFQKEITVTNGEANLNRADGQVPDFKSIVKLLDSSGREVKLVDQTSYLTAPFGACIVGDHLRGYTLKVKEDGTYILFYRLYLTPMQSLTDICIIPDPECIAAYAYAQIRRSETDPLGDADNNLKECDSRIEAMIEDINRNEGDLTFKSLY